MKTLTIYSKPGCHLCDEMKTVVTGVVGQRPPGTLVVEEIDISTDPDLEATYGRDIPVLMIDGRRVARYRVTTRALVELLDG